MATLTANTGRRRLLTPASLTAATLAVSAGVGAMAALTRPTLFALAGVIAVAALVAVTWEHPSTLAVLVVVASPIYPMLLTHLDILGAPAGADVLISYWKDVVLLVLAVRLLMVGTDKWDTLDYVAVAYLAVLIIYLVLPIGATLQGRIVAFRADGALALLFLAGRHLARGRGPARWFELTVMATGVFAAVDGLINHFLPSLWIAIDAVLYNGGSTLVIGERLGGQYFIRSVAIFGQYIALAFYMLVPFALAVSHLATSRFRLRYAVLAALFLSAILVTLTRSAIGGVPLILVMAFLAGDRGHHVAAWALVGGAAILPLVAAVGLGERLANGVNVTDSGTAGHITALQESILRLAAHPLGEGLASAGSLSFRFHVNGGFINESWFLQLGTEIGIVGMLLYIALVVLSLRTTLRLARQGSRLALAAACALAAISAGGLVLHSIEDRSVAWALWFLVGLGAAPLRTEVEARPVKTWGRHIPT